MFLVSVSTTLAPETLRDSGEDANLDEWSGDVCAALEVLAEGTGAAKIGVVGLRLGSALAFKAATARSSVAKLVLWSPVVRGNEYLQELDRTEREWRQGSLSKRPAPQETPERMGFPLCDSLAAQIAQVDLLCSDKLLAADVLIVESSSSRAVERLQENLQWRTGQSRYLLLGRTGGLAQVRWRPGRGADCFPGPRTTACKNQ